MRVDVQFPGEAPVFEQRNNEYDSFELGSVINEEITSASEGIILSDKKRTEKFAEIFISEDELSELDYEVDNNIEDQLLWQFGKKIAELLDEPDSTKVITYVYRYTIAFLFLTLNPVKELNNLKNLLGTNDSV